MTVLVRPRPASRAALPWQWTITIRSAAGLLNNRVQLVEAELVVHGMVKLLISAPTTKTHVLQAQDRHFRRGGERGS